MDLNALRAFVAVIEAGGITEAARRLGMPKSTVSRLARELAATLPEPLLERHGRGLRATLAGRRLHEAARTAIGTLEHLRDDLRQGGVAGRLQVASPVVFGRGLLHGVVNGFLERHPAVNVEVTLTHRLATLLAPGADIAICVGFLPDGRHPYHHLGIAEARLYAAPALIGRRSALTEPSSLAEVPVLAQGCDRTGITRWRLTGPDGTITTTAVVPRLVCPDPDMLIAAALAGRGVVRLAAFLGEPLVATGRLAPVLPGWTADRHEVAIALLRRPREPAVRRFVAEATESLRARLGWATPRPVPR